MPVFKYEALDSQGVAVKDEIEALSQKEAINKIRNMGYFPTKVQTGKAGEGAGKKGAGKGKAGAKQKPRRGAGGRVKVRLVTQFARQLSTLQDAGLPILRSLRILEEQQKSGTFKRVIGYTADDIEGGATLSEALSRFPKTFDKLFVNMVAAGETGGVLDLILARLADFMEKTQKLKAKVKGAMIYPLVVLTAARAAVSDKGLVEVAAIARSIMKKVYLFATLDTLQYLVKGGRVPKAAALASSLLQIKPIFTVSEGEAHLVANVRTNDGALKHILKLMGRKIIKGHALHVAVMHADSLDRATALKDQISSRFNCAELFITEFTPVMGVHTGPGVIGAAFCRD